MKRFISLLMVLVLVVALAACGGNETTPPPAPTPPQDGASPTPQPESPAQQHHMRWYLPEPEGHPWTDVAFLIIDEIYAQSEGNINIIPYPAGSLGTQPEAVNMMRTGSIELVTTGPGVFASFFDAVQVLALPFLFDNAAQAYHILDGPVGQELFNEVLLDASGIRTIDFWYFGDRVLTTDGHAIMQPSDLQGLNIRSMDTPVSRNSISAMGAVPIPISFAELYLALQTGVVAGQENPIPTIIAQRFYEVQDHVILTRHSVHMGTVHFSEQLWQQLTVAEQQIILDAFALYRDEITQRIYAATEEGIQYLLDRGVTIIEPDIEAFRTHATDAIMEIYGDDLDWTYWFSRIQEAR